MISPSWGRSPLSLREVSALDEALGESDLPFKVDIVEWARIDEGFRRIIRGMGWWCRGWREFPIRLVRRDGHCQPR